MGGRAAEKTERGSCLGQRLRSGWRAACPERLGACGGESRARNCLGAAGHREEGGCARRRASRRWGRGRRGGGGSISTRATSYSFAAGYRDLSGLVDRLGPPWFVGPQPCWPRPRLASCCSCSPALAVSPRPGPLPLQLEGLDVWYGFPFGLSVWTGQVYA